MIRTEITPGTSSVPLTEISSMISANISSELASESHYRFLQESLLKFFIRNLFPGIKEASKRGFLCILLDIHPEIPTVISSEIPSGVLSRKPSRKNDMGLPKGIIIRFKKILPDHPPGISLEIPSEIL